MMDWSIGALVVWIGSFLVVSVDSAAQGISPWFWRAASLFGGPLILVAYVFIRESSRKRQPEK